MTGALMELSAQRLADLEARYPRLFHLSWKEWRRRAGAAVLFAGVIAFCFWKMDFGLSRVLQGLGKLGWMFQLLFPPAHHGWLDVYLYAMLETLAMAFLGTLFAFLAAVPLGFLGAKNILPNFAAHFAVRRFLDFIRGIDSVILALIFITVVGLGPFAGVLAIAVSDMGVLAKLFAEAIENVERDQVEGVRATGAKPVQVMRFGFLPQVFPVMLSNGLYFFESNTRSATILGVVGAGGIGTQLTDRIRINNWDEVCFIVLLILVTVALIDTLSKEIRLRIIRRGGTRP
jgi:phosphonate transport system permease protein